MESFNIFHKMLSLWINWLPMCLIIDITIQDLYPQNTQYSHKTFGRLTNKEYQSQIIFYTIIYLLLLFVLKFKFHQIKKTLRNNLDSLKQKIQSNTFKSKNETLEFVHKLFPTTTRILYNCNILLIGTCHLSETSAIQSSEIIKLLEPDAVVLELDEKRAKNLFKLSPKVARLRLIKDLLSMKTYYDPITLFARIGTRCMSFFCLPGKEFKLSAETAWNINKNKNKKCSVIYGDQDITKTVESIQKATPIIVRILLNICLFIGYLLPMIYGFIHCILDIFQCIYYKYYQMLIFKCIISIIIWIGWSIFIKIIIQILTEKSKAKKGMSQMNKLLSLIGCILPCLAKIFKSSDVKTARDQMLIQSTLNAIPYNNGNKDKLVISVIGLAHMNDMAEIAKKYNNYVLCEV